MTSLTYDGGTSSGHSGTDTSRERAARDDADGTTSLRQSIALRWARDAGVHGLTVKDLRSHPKINHHGTASSTLTNLERDGRLILLAERRDGCHVYVLPHHAGMRDRAPRRASRTDLTPDEVTLVTALHGVASNADLFSATVQVSVDQLTAVLDLVHRLAGRG